MKINTIEQICKTNKTILLTESHGIQWISDGVAAYPLHGLPILSEKNIFTMFDIPEEKRDKFYFEAASNFLSTLNIEDLEADETQLEKGTIALYSEGRILIPLRNNSDLIFINNKYLSPFSDIEMGVTLHKRVDKAGKTYIAIKGGLFLVGIILPLDIVTKDFVSEFEALTKLVVALAPKDDENIPEQIDINYHEEQDNKK